ncbi:YfkD famly protein [Sediminibacillus massiliensis]|uniref:YfkD famly protein n=1 Tax=Sediminibacillus massiliensis TaxID=1926277 RepID=UPI00098851B5|nr:YfkD famly protein [Sediminibacillus massiliensis]
MYNKKIAWIVFLAVLAVFMPFQTLQAEEAEHKSDKDKVEVPNHVLNISKENTYPNSSRDEAVLEPSDLVKELVEESKINIENPELIKLLNETTLKPSPLAIGYRGLIYMGHWPLNYESQETNLNWEFQKINVNQLNNLGGNNQKNMSYNQEEEKHVKGALTAKINNADQVKRMMLLKAKKHTNLPLSFHTVFGEGTKKENSYGIPVKKIGNLTAYAPAVNEKGQVTFGEVYLELKGSNKRIVVKNVTKQGVGAWIPIQDHVSFSFQLK